MTFKPSIENFSLSQSLIIRSNGAMWTMPKQMKDSFTRIWSIGQERKVNLCSAPFAYYQNVNWKELISQSFIKMIFEMFTYKWTYACGIEWNYPTDNLPSDIEVINVPNCKVVTCLHYGAYSGVSKTYKQLYKWMEEQNYQAIDSSYEFYLNSPATVKKADLQTKIIIPIKN